MNILVFAFLAIIMCKILGFIDTGWVWILLLPFILFFVVVFGQLLLGTLLGVLMILFVHPNG